MAQTERKGVFINTRGRPDFEELVDKIRKQTGIVHACDVVYQAVRRWEAELRRLAALQARRNG